MQIGRERVGLADCHGVCMGHELILKLARQEGKPKRRYPSLLYLVVFVFLEWAAYVCV